MEQIADKDGWIKNDGKQPVNDNVKVDVKFRNGGTGNPGYPAESWTWEICEEDTTGYTITHWKPHQSEQSVVETSTKITSDGGSSDYYKIKIVRTEDGAEFECETYDIIYALVGGDFMLGNALKALRRIYEDSQGRGKAGIDMSYDATKINFFVKTFLERNSNKNENS